MPPPAEGPPAKPRRAVAWRWAAGVAAFLALTAPWTVPVSSDGLAILRTALSLFVTGSFRLATPPPGSWTDPYLFRTPPGGGPGVDFGYQPLGSIARAALLAGAGLAPPGPVRGRVADAALQLLPVALTALALVPLARLARLAGCPRRASPALASALLLATFVGPLGRSDYQEPIVVLLSAWSLERALVARRLTDPRRLSALAAAGGLAALALLAKPTAFVLVPALCIAAARPLRRPAGARDFAALAAGAVPALAAFFTLNLVRFGSPLDLGYRFGRFLPGAERVSPAWTVLRLTVLPNRGLLWFAPLLLLAFFRPFADRLREPLRTDCGAALAAAGGFFAANVWWWAWEGGFGWGPRILAPAVVLCMPCLAGRGRLWRRAAVLLAIGGFALNLPAYLLDDGRLYEVAAASPVSGAPLGPVVPRHLEPGSSGRVHPYQRVHYVPAEASWLLAPRILLALRNGGDGSEAGGAGIERNDAALLRLLLGKPALHAFAGVGRLLLDDAEVSGEVEPERALAFARAAIDFGGPPAETRAYASMLLLRRGRAAEAARLCREALALDPSRADARSNLALAEAMLEAEGVKRPVSPGGLRPGPPSGAAPPASGRP